MSHGCHCPAVGGEGASAEAASTGVKGFMEGQRKNRAARPRREGSSAGTGSAPRCSPSPEPGSGPLSSLPLGSAMSAAVPPPVEAVRDRAWSGGSVLLCLVPRQSHGSAAGVEGAVSAARLCMGRSGLSFHVSPGP